MRYNWIGLIAVVLLSGCGGWGDYVHKSDRFKFKVVFPQKWEIWDRSNDRDDHLVASLPYDIPEAHITVRATPSAPDISANEIYPTFMDGGGDGAILPEFVIENKEAISCKNREGRQITYTYLTERHRMKGIRTLFIGTRFILRVDMEMPADNFADHEVEFRKMVSLMEL